MAYVIPDGGCAGCGLVDFDDGGLLGQGGALVESYRGIEAGVIGVGASPCEVYRIGLNSVASLSGAIPDLGAIVLATLMGFKYEVVIDAVFTGGCHGDGGLMTDFAIDGGRRGSPLQFGIVEGIGLAGLVFEGRKACAGLIDADGGGAKAGAGSVGGYARQVSGGFGAERGSFLDPVDALRLGCCGEEEGEHGGEERGENTGMDAGGA